MRFVAFRITKITEQPGEAEEAFASCWINMSKAEEAMQRARRFMTNAGWRVEEVLEDHPVSRDSYRANSSGVDYYEQALTDDEVAVIYLVRPDKE